MQRLAWSVVLLGVFVRAAAGQSAFEAEIEAQHGKVSAAFQKASQLSMAGEIDAAEREIRSIMDDDKSIAATLVVADALFNTDRDLSYKLHKQVYEAKPDERTTVLEWAMERHRAGEYAEAIPLYEKYLKLVPNDGRMSALLADCLMRVGKLDEAVSAWEAAGHPHQHTSIDFAIYEIYGKLSPAARRGELIKQIRAGQLNRIEELVDLDLHFDQDWWNSEANSTALGFDVLFVQDLLKADQPRWDAIQSWVDISSNSITADEVKTRLKKSRVIVDGGALPANSLVAARLMGVVLEKKLMTKEQLLKQFEAELLKRAKSKEGDVEALNMLSNLTEDNQERLGEFDRYGWERYGDFRFAGGTLAAMSIKNQLKPDSPELKKALEQFPENSIVNGFAMRTISPENISTSDLVRAIKAEFREPSFGMAIRDTYTLKSYFQLLKEKLKSGK